MKPIAVTGLLLTTCFGAPSAFAQTDARPTYSFLRFTEDWSFLAQAESSDPWDSLKYIELSDDGQTWVSFGGHMRARLENWSSFAFGTPAVDNDTFVLWRLALHADLHVNDNVRVFVEGKSALSTDRDLPGGRRTLEVDSLALEQAFADLTFDVGDDATLTLRAGRQQFLFGKQRLVSPLPWANTMRRWDGVSAIVASGGWNIHGFWSQVVPVRKYDFNQADAQTQFYGVYATRKPADGSPGIDLYALGLDGDDPVPFNGTTGPEERYTLGGRLFGPIADTALSFDFEGAYQFGEVGAGDIDAYMLAGLLTHKTTEDLTLSVGADVASGDDTSGGDVETFNQLFPLGHAYHGYIDVVGRQNIIDVHGTASLKVAEKTTAAVAFHSFWRESSADALYNAGGGVVRGATAGADRHVGYEIDVTLKHGFGPHLAGLFGYSHFFAGDFISDTGSSEDTDFVYVQLQYTF